VVAVLGTQPGVRKLFEGADFLPQRSVLRLAGTELGSNGINQAITFCNVSLEPSSVVMYSGYAFISYVGHKKAIISPLRRTRKLRALILLEVDAFLCWTFLCITTVDIVAFF
jgi:hypothetical protein